MIIYLPRKGEPGTPREALRLYTALSGEPEWGFQLRVNVVAPDGRGTDKIYSVVCAISPACGLTMEGAEALRASVREFARDRLAAFYQAGGQFRGRHDIDLGGRGKPALTPSGADKFHRILEGRLSTPFLDAALRAGVADPFGLALPPPRVRAFGGFQSLPQPAHPDLHLLNPREVVAGGSSVGFRATLVWTQHGGGEPFRQDVEFGGIDGLVQFVKAIDRWTTESIAAGEAQLPTHAGTQVLRRLCEPYRSLRGPSVP